MAALEFVRVSADGTQIIVRDEHGVESAMPMDDRLAAALIPRSSPVADASALSPREIQARIRSGADVQGLADETGTSVERIMAFAVPILQERAHIASRARTTMVSRAAGVGPLEDVIVGRLSPLGVAIVDTHWDAHRLDDGRWRVTLTYETREGARIATWVFDAKAAVVTPVDDEAHWLMGEPPVVPERRTTATKPTLPVFRKVEEPSGNVVPMKRREEAPVVDEEAPPVDEEFSQEPPEAPERPVPRSGKKRPSVPSWDEILFGAPTDEH